MKDEPRLSPSIAATLLTRSPKHAWTEHRKLNPDYQEKHSTTFDLGKAVHANLLERVNPMDALSGQEMTYPGKTARAKSVVAHWSDRFAVIKTDTYQSAAAQAARDEAYEEGRTPLTLAQAQRIEAVVDGLQPMVKALGIGYPDQGKPEVRIQWRHEATDVACSSVLDWVPHEGTRILDVKTTEGSAEPDQWSWQNFRTVRLALQAAFYEAAMRIEFDRECELFFVAVELDPPYAWSLVGLDDMHREIAEKEYERACETWAHCLDNDDWPAYPFADRPYYAMAPFKAAKEHERRMMEGDL